MRNIGELPLLDAHRSQKRIVPTAFGRAVMLEHTAGIQARRALPCATTERPHATSSSTAHDLQCLCAENGKRHSSRRSHERALPHLDLQSPDRMSTQADVQIELHADEEEEMESSQELVSRLKQKYPMLHTFTDRPFGIEIEFFGLQYYILPPDNGIIKPHNIHSKAKDGRELTQLLSDYKLSLGTDKDSWHLEEDSSIVHRGGVELISPILRGMDGLMEAYRFFQLLREIRRVSIDYSCGFHVHHGVDRHAYQCEQLKELVRIIYAIEDYVYLLIGENRFAKETCRPMDLDINDFQQLKECGDECVTHGCQIKRLWYSSENRYDPDCNRSDRYDMTRYHGLNLHSYWYRSTIEFRYHSAVLDAVDEAMQWIIFTQFLVELSAGNVPIIDYHLTTNKWMKTMYKVYLAFGHMNRIRGWHPGKAVVSKEPAERQAL